MARHHRLFLIRHLPTAANRRGAYCGWTDDPLSEERGKAIQWEMKPKRIYGSDLQRARQTAAIYFPDAEYCTDSRLRECHFGEFEGKTYEQLKHDETYRRWIDDPYQSAPAQGETLLAVRERVLNALSELPNDAIVVTHGGPIRLALEMFSPQVKSFWDWQVTNGSIWQFEWEDKKDLEEGRRCTYLSEVPIMASGNS